MNLDMMLDGLRAAVPYNAHLGLEYVTLEPGRCVVRLPDDERLRNHVASQHAAGMFSAGEAASGGAFTAAFAEELASLRPLVTGAEVEYTKLALGPITASATLGEELDAIRARLDAEGTVRFPVHVEMHDVDGNEVARMTVSWRLKRA